MYQTRFYREWTKSKLETFNVKYKETDLLISASGKRSSLCLKVVKDLRNLLEEYIKIQPEFKKSLNPITVLDTAPLEIKEMAEQAKRLEVGPMAGVAGLFAEKVAKAMLEETEEIIVENGGDIFLKVNNEIVIGIYAGKKSPFSQKIGLKITANKTPLAICTSAGTVGPSISMGKTDAAIVLSPSAVLADLGATALGNRVKTEEDINEAINWIKGIEGIVGAVICINDKLGVWGDIELVKTKEKK